MSNPRDDERRKFEAAAIKVKATRTNWLRQHGVPISQEFAEFADAIGELTDLAEARAEQADTPRAAEKEHFCKFCGVRDDATHSEALCPDAANFHRRHVFAAAAPVEDRPAPTPEDK